MEYSDIDQMVPMQRAQLVTPEERFVTKALTQVLDAGGNKAGVGRGTLECQLPLTSPQDEHASWVGTGIGFRIARAHQWCIMRRVAQTAGETVSGVLTLTTMQGI